MGIKETIFLLILSCFYASFSFAQGIVIQGQVLNSSSKLVSKNRIFTLQFHTIGTSYSNGSYFGIWFSSISGYRPCWISNRDRPIPDNSGVFALDASGTMKLNYSSADVVTFYSNQSSNVNLTAELEDSGNLILRNANSPIQEILWQSFDTPTDSFLPGMKLGTNRVSGQKWSIISWLTDSVPSSGAFTLEWNATGNGFVIRRRGVLFWTCRSLTSSGFENFLLNIGAVDFNFTNVLNANEDSVKFSVALNEYSSLNNVNIHMMYLRFDGSLIIDSRVFAGVEICNGNNGELDCERWEGPTCRNNGARFELRTGYFGGNVPREIDTNASLSISDCMDICWKNCSCAGIAAQTTHANNTGCSFYFGDFTGDPSGRQMQYYVIVEDASGK